MPLEESCAVRLITNPFSLVASVKVLLYVSSSPAGANILVSASSVVESAMSAQSITSLAMATVIEVVPEPVASPERVIVWFPVK